MKKLAALLSAVVLSGCTTVSDFIAMTPEEMAVKTCSNSAVLAAEADELKRLAELIAAADGNIARGYALHRQCIDQEVPYTTQGNCWTDYFGNLRCSQYTSTRTVTSCTDVPVAVDVDEERRKSAQYKELFARMMERNKAHVAECYNRVLEMSPQEAFELWEKRGYPQTY